MSLVLHAQDEYSTLVIETTEGATQAGFPMVVSRAAVTKAAVDIATKENATLVGFIRKNSGNIYYEGKVKLNEQSR